MSITLNLGGQDYVVRAFRDETHGFESMRAYIDEVVAPIMRFLPEISTIRCAYSGLPTAITTLNEIDDCIATGIRNLNLDRFNDLLAKYTDQDIIDGIESLVDDISIRMILSWKKSASLTFSRDGAVIAAVSETKKLAILLGMFLFLEDKRRDHAIEDEVSMRRKQAALADTVTLQFGTNPIWQELLNTLIELDAKYRITKVSLNKKEIDALHDILSMDSLNPELVCGLVRRIIDWRDEYKPERFSDGTSTWTQTAWVKINREMQARERFSNIVEEPKVVILGKEYKAPKNKAEQEKLDKKQLRANILKSIFGNLGGMGA